MKKILILALLLPFIGLKSQVDSTEKKTRFIQSYQGLARHPYLEASAEFQALSNQLSARQISNLLGDDFLDNSEKDALLNSIDGPLRFGYFREFSFEYRKPAVKVFDQARPGQGFRISNKYFRSARLDETTLDLIFYGNKRFEDQTLQLGPARLQTWYYTSLDYVFDIRLDTLQLAEFSVGVLLGHDHNDFDLRSGSLYTAPNGEYLDVDLDYSLRDQSGETLPLNGLGLALGFATTWDLGERNRLIVRASDLGVMYWNRGRLLDTDSTFRFTGAGFDNILDINDSLTDGLDDQYREAFIYEDEDNYLSLLPFYLNAEFIIHRKRKIEELSFGAEYRYLPGFLPRLYAGASIRTGFRQLLGIEASTGGYNLARLDVNYRLRLGDNWELMLAIYNLNGLVFIDQPAGAGGGIRLRYRL